MQSMPSKSNPGLSTPVIIVSGFVAALFAICTWYVISQYSQNWFAKSADIDVLLRKGEYQRALSALAGENAGGPQKLMQQGKVWFALAWERQNRDGWRSYGLNPRDWLDCPEADKAEQFLLQTVEKNPRNAEAHFLLGKLYKEKGRFALAEASFMDALRTDDHNIDIHIALSALYTTMNRLELAKAELLRAWQIDGDNAKIAKNCAFLYRFYLDRPDSAILWANRYMNISPENDYDINLIRNELVNLLDRYPEFAPSSRFSDD
jgi:tetratricopeptide (TPR) repeat protein